MKVTSLHLQRGCLGVEFVLVFNSDRRRREPQRMRWLYGTTDSTDMSFSNLREIVKDRKTWPSAVHEVAKSGTQFSDCTTTTKNSISIIP